ncbi:MAG: hypothetical protein JOZ96_26440 [Acidobacteria bacterium]|nr:hypothetical protein [Acidobacteriota bacterium]
MTKHEFIRVLVRAAGVILLAIAAWYTLNFFGNLLAVPFSGAEPVYIHMFVMIVVLASVGGYLTKDGRILFNLLDS